MASNNAPKHDFAPAWLKIPNQENSKPPGTKQGEACHEDRFSRSYHSEGSPLSPTGSDYSKRFTTSQGSKFRHHSVEDDYYAYTYGPYSYYNGYGYDKYNMHYGSQPTLLRAQAQRDSKYQHPHARYGPAPGQAVNVGYQSYYDFLPHYEYYGSDPYYTNYSTARGSKRNSEKEGRSNSKEGKEKDEKKEKDGEKDKPFHEDFPSLNGGTEKCNGKTSGQMNGSGVWENPPNSKNGGRVGEESYDTSQSKVLRENIYKNLVPNKSTIPRRPARVNGSYPREQSPFAGLKPPTPTSSPCSPGFSKETGQSPTAPMDILNTRFVTTPKTLSDKKSHFLKALRQEDGKKSIRKGDGDLVNGVDNLSVADDGSNLSSSLEAEQRLLREMGWNEDDEEYEITEDEKKEFQNLSKQVQLHQQQGRNGLVKNGGSVKPIPNTLWSPKHIPVYQPNANELNETLSSSDSDSDDAENWLTRPYCIVVFLYSGSLGVFLKDAVTSGLYLKSCGWFLQG